MNGIIIVNQSIGHNEYKIKRFQEEFFKLGVDIQVVVNNGLIAKIENNNIVTSLPKADFIIYLDKDIYLARLLEKHGYRLFNKADFIKMCDDKVLTFIACANKNIPMPKTFAGPLVFSNSENANTEFLDTIIEELGLPLIVKKVYGSLGEGVYLVKTKEELLGLYLKICHNPLLFQKDMTNSFGKSVRVLIIDGKVFGAFQRINKYDFRSNFGDKAGGELIPNPEKYLKFAQEISDKLDIEYAGIDLLDDENGKPILCEINSNAFFEEFEKVTKLNAAEAYCKMVIRRCKQ